MNLKPSKLSDRTEIDSTALSALIVALQKFLVEKASLVVMANRDAAGAQSAASVNGRFAARAASISATQ
jgi:hypothetical protein